MRIRHSPAAAAAAAAAVLLLALGAGTAGGKDPTGPTRKPATNKVILFAADGMRQDMVERYVEAGEMPTFEALMKQGARGANGLTQGFPPNTGVGWYTLASGTWAGGHGSTNNTFFRTGEGNFNNSTSFATPGILQADTIQQAVERAGRTVVSMEWVGSRTLVPPLRGPVVDFRTFLSNRGVLVNYALPGQPAGAAAFGVSYQRVTLAPATGWVNVPTSYSSARELQLLVSITSAAYAVLFFFFFVYDST